MPVILRVSGYKLFFYEAAVTSEPPHVHITREGNEAKLEKTTYAISNALSKIIWSFS